VHKNNNQKREAMIISDGLSSMVPNIYLERYYDGFIEGREMNDIAKEIINIALNNQSDNDVISQISDINTVSSRIVFRLINRSLNKERLSEVPHIIIENMSKVYFVVLDIIVDGVSSIMITNDLLSLWNMSPEKLDELSNINTPKLFPSIIKNMNECICDILSDQKEELTIEEDEHFEDFLNDYIKDMSSRENERMYVLSNNKGINGAGAILYPNVLQELASKLNSDLYILPSSIHEVILLPARDRMSSRALREMVIDVNSSQVAPEEVLSNEIYYYDLSTDEFHIANYKR
jgi:ribosomal protein S8